MTRRLPAAFRAAALALAWVAPLAAQRPSIMVIPSDRYLLDKGYVEEFTVGGRKTRVPDYARAFQEDRNLRNVIASIAGAFQDRGFPLRDLEAAMKAQQEAAALEQASARAVAESPRDQLLKRARPDVALDLDFAEERVMGETSITFTLRAIDAFTSNEVATTTGTGQPGAGVPLAVLLREAVVQRMPQLEGRLTRFFEDMVANGRQIRVRVRVTQDAGFDLEEELKGKTLAEAELADHVRALVKKGAVQGIVQPGPKSETMLEFTTVRIPVVDDEKLPLDADTWANRAVVRPLRAELGVRARRETVGLGDVTIVITGKGA